MGGEQDEDPQLLPEQALLGPRLAHTWLHEGRAMQSLCRQELRIFLMSSLERLLHPHRGCSERESRSWTSLCAPVLLKSPRVQVMKGPGWAYVVQLMAVGGLALADSQAGPTPVESAAPERSSPAPAR